MTLRVLAIDWSGAQQGAKRTIWLAEVIDGQISRLECGRDRGQIVDELVALQRSGDELVAGLDFAFSLPAWYVRSRASSAPELWDWLADGRGEEILAACPEPFWGRPGRRRPSYTAECPAFRRTEEITASASRTGASGGPRSLPKSVFQIGGAGAVGTGSLRGMLELRRLRATGFAIWPFDDPTLPLIVEIYPRVLTGPVVKSSGDARREYLELHGCGDRMSPEAFADATSGEDAFDAAVSALALAEHAEDLQSLPAIVDEKLRIEGIIWQPGWRESHEV